MCLPVGKKSILSTAATRNWLLFKLYLKMEFLQTGQTELEVYVLQPCESSDKGRCARLLLTTACGDINVNGKWKVLSEVILTDIGF